jgi:trk system potassium uptake protein TrkH
VNTAIIYKLLSMVLLALACSFCVCAGAGLWLGESIHDESIQAFLSTIGISIGLAALFYMLGRKGEAKLFRREALCAIGLSWILATIVGALPYTLVDTGGSIADAIFESASGLTTTGATSFSNFYEFPKSLLIWRSMSQWIGGLGVVVFFVAILSSLGAGAKILFSNESSGTSADFDHGRIQSGAFQLMLFYLGISLACVGAYKLGGMDWFQAINHAMTTVSTGGFSTEPMSMEQFQSPTLEWISIFFMAVCGTTFVYMIRLLRGQTHILRQDNEVYWFYGLIIGSTLLLMVFLIDLTGQLPDHNSLRTSAFQAVSIITTTGYSSTDFNAWLPPAKMTLLLVMFVGGCSGSTSGGVKVVRIVIAIRAAVRSITHAFRPNVTIPMRMGGQALSERAIHSVVLFIILMTSLQLLAMLFVSANEPHLSFTGVFSCVQATLFNIGPGFEEIGPAENFQFLRSSTKVFLSLLMILGRLELYAVMVLFIPSVWKRFS